MQGLHYFRKNRLGRLRQGLRSSKNRSLLGVNEDFESKRNAVSASQKIR